MAYMGVLHVRYQRTRSWNCEKFFDCPEDLKEWLDHERKVGNLVKQNGPNEYTVVIDY